MTRFLMKADAPVYHFLRDGSVWRVVKASSPLSPGTIERVFEPIPRLIIASRVHMEGNLRPRVYHPQPMAFFYWIGAVAKACWDGIRWLFRPRS
jgi:hypothetical protein